MRTLRTSTKKSKYCLENSKEVEHPKVQSLSLIFTFAWNLVNYSLCTSKNCFVEGKWLVFSGIVAVISGFLSRLWKKRGKTLMHFKEFGFLYSGFLNHCQGTKRDCLWFFVLIQTMKVYQIISCQARISQGKKNVKVFKPTAHVFIIFFCAKSFACFSQLGLQ